VQGADISTLVRSASRPLVDAALARTKFGTKATGVTVVLLIALIGANVLNLAADLMAIGQGMHLLHAGPAPLWAAVAGSGIALTVTLGSFANIERVFKWLCMALLSYVVVLFAVQVHWAGVVRGLTGQQFRLEPAYLSLIVAVLGTSISPYLFFWQSAHRIEELRAEDLAGDDALALHRRGAQGARRKLRNSRIDVVVGMAFSVIVMFAIMAATAATLGSRARPSPVRPRQRRRSNRSPGAPRATSSLPVSSAPGSSPCLSSRPRGLPGSRVCSTSRGGSTAVLAARPSSTRCSWSAWWAGHTLSMASPRARGPGSTWENTDARTHCCHHRSERRDRGRGSARADPHR
jgi:hypothetical protein